MEYCAKPNEARDHRKMLVSTLAFVDALLRKLTTSSSQNLFVGSDLYCTYGSCLLTEHHEQHFLDVYEPREAQDKQCLTC